MVRMHVPALCGSRTYRTLSMDQAHIHVPGPPVHPIRAHTTPSSAAYMHSPCLQKYALHTHTSPKLLPVRRTCTYHPLAVRPTCTSSLMVVVGEDQGFLHWTQIFIRCKFVSARERRYLLLPLLLVLGIALSRTPSPLSLES